MYQPYYGVAVKRTNNPDNPNNPYMLGCGSQQPPPDLGLIYLDDIGLRIRSSASSTVATGIL